MQDRKITITIVLFWLVTTLATVLAINTRYVNVGIASDYFVDESDIKFAFKVYRKYYNGFETSDRIIYDINKKEYLEKRDEVNLEKVSKLDFTLFEKNYDELNASGELEEYFDVKKIIGNVDGEPTMVLFCRKYTEYDTDYIVINLKDKSIITDKVNIEDLLL